MWRVELNRIDFGKLVAALRKEVRDDDERCWTQKRLGEQTGLGKVIVGKIERGQRVNLDSDTLSLLANALRLTSSERKEFFIAANGIDDHQVARPGRNPEGVLKEMVDMIEGIQFPAFIVDGYGDFVAAKKAMIRLFEIPNDALASASSEPAGFNLMRLIFAPEFHDVRTILGRQWHRTAVYNMDFFRCITLRYRLTDYFAGVLSQLRRYPLFRQYWQEVHLEQDDYFATLSTGLTTYGELYLVAYLPANARTTEVFASLRDQGGDTVLPLAPWPEKALLVG